MPGRTAMGTANRIGGNGTIKSESRSYFGRLGKHIGLLRKARGMTQADLARAIGVSQQAVFAYEIGDRRVSVLILVKIAQVFDVSVENLIRMNSTISTSKRRPFSLRVAHLAQRIYGLSKTQQRFVKRIVDVLEDQADAAHSEAG